MKKTEWEYEGGINLTPLLDVILNLLFFFILATQMKESKEFIDINLPKSEQVNTAEQQNEFIIINIDNKNNVFIDDEKIDLNKLSEILIEKGKSKKITKVIIRGDAETYNQTIVTALDECAKANLNSISLEVAPK